MKRAEPITPELILDLHKLAYKEDNLVTWRTYWRISMASHGLFRWSDLACMKISDVSFIGDTAVFHIPRSKTDQVRQGCQLSLTQDPSSPFPSFPCGTDKEIHSPPQLSFVRMALATDSNTRFAAKNMAAIKDLLFDMSSRSSQAHQQDKTRCFALLRTLRAARRGLHHSQTRILMARYQTHGTLPF